MFDVLIVGAGPAGLSAALLLGRCRRPVLICDSGRPRNYATRYVHGFLTRDGIPPAEFRQIARNDLEKYPSVDLRNLKVMDIVRKNERFDATLSDGCQVTARMLLFACGQLDRLPPVPGAEQYYGKGVFHCPICDGWEHRNLPWAVYGRGRAAAEYALEMLIWTRDVVLCSDGPAGLEPDQRARLEFHRIPVIEERLGELEGDGEKLALLTFASGKSIPCRALFFYTSEYQRSDLPTRVGCVLTSAGEIQCDGHAATQVPGVFVAGNVRPGLNMAIVAAAEGAEAAFRMNAALLEADLHGAEAGRQA